MLFKTVQLFCILFRDFSPQLLHLIQLLLIKTKRTKKYTLVIAFIAFGGSQRSRQLSLHLTLDSLFSVEGDRGAGEGWKRENRGREAGAEINKAIVCCILLGLTQSKTHLHLYFSVW